MSKNVKKLLVPKLRFPEFRDAGEWGSFPLSEFVKTLDAGVSVNSGDRPAGSGEAGILKTSAVTNGIFEPLENKVVLDEGELQRLKEPVCEGTIIISRMNTPVLVGANAYVEKSLSNIYLPDRLWAAKPKPDTSMRFIACILGSEQGRAALCELASGSSGTMKNITKPDVLALQISAPSFLEQKKIADCLFSLDALISAQRNKLDALKNHKKGLMQQLFPRDGETIPRLRFPEFLDAGEWIFKPLGKVGINLDSKRVPITESERVKGLVPYYGASGIIDYVKYYIYDEELLCISEDGANLVARTYPIAFPISGKTWVNNHAHVLKFDNIFTQVIVENYLNALNLEAYLTGMAQPKLNRAKLDTIPIPLPEPGEQLLIANCLSSIDALISAHGKKLEALKNHKKGLMQNLFPAVDEVKI